MIKSRDRIFATAFPNSKTRLKEKPIDEDNYNDASSTQQKAERKLIQLAKNGDKNALEKLVNQHMFLSVSLASYFISKCPSLEREREDLIREGIVGIIEAVKTYDLDRGVKFSTYSVWYVLSRQQRYIRNANSFFSMPLSKHLQELRIRDELDRISLYSEFSEKEEQINMLAKRLGYQDEKKFNELMLIAATKIVFLDQPLDEEGLSVTEAIASETNISREVINNETLKELISYINQKFLENKSKYKSKQKSEMTKNDKLLIFLLYSDFLSSAPDDIICFTADLLGVSQEQLMKYIQEEKLTYTDIGNLLGISKQAVEQQWKSAVRMLKNDQHVRCLLGDLK